MQVDVLAAQRLSINSVSFANNKRNGFGFCFDQAVVLDNVVPNKVRMNQLMCLCGAPHKLTYVAHLVM